MSFPVLCHVTNAVERFFFYINEERRRSNGIGVGGTAFSLCVRTLRRHVTNFQHIKKKKFSVTVAGLVFLP